MSGIYLKNNQNIYGVLLPIPSKNSSIFDYLYTDSKVLPIGLVVRVPFGGNKTLWGIIREKRSFTHVKKLKYIIETNDRYIISQNLISFIDWVSEWTMSSKGSVLKLVFTPNDVFENKNNKFGWLVSPNINEDFLDNKLPKLKLTKKSKDVLGFLNRTNPMTTEKLIASSNVSRNTILKLEKNNLIIRENIFEKKKKFKFNNINNSNIKLNSSQKNAVEIIENIISKKNYAAILLDGVTGSGKTEVYFQAILNALKQDKQVLVLLPEIYLSTEWTIRFKNYFGDAPLIWHSNLSKRVRRETWEKIENGENNVIVGARSALFLPFKNLGLIVVDEEHDHSFKQEEGVLYNARDMALIRAKIENIAIILSSATPSIETWVNAKNNKYAYARLSERIGVAKMPGVKIIDMRNTDMKFNKWISPLLKEKLSENLIKNNLSLLFLNRRGYAPLKLCSSCGYRLSCRNCESWLVEHKRNNSLICHQCGLTQLIKKNCASCGKEDTLISCGPGVERLEEEVLYHFPDIKIEVLSSDTVKNPESMETLLSKIQNSEVDIIIGTQMISKGHNFKNLTIVGIVDADMSLSGGDLRASEKAFQLLHQVSGRAGREDKKGIVLIQTYDPNNQVIEALRKNKRDEFLTIENDFRKQTNLPPYGRFVSIIISSKDMNLLERFTSSLKKSAPNFENVIILGPAPAPITFLRGKFRYRFLIKSSREINIQKVIRNWLKNIKIPANVKLTVDIEPYSFL